MISNRILLGLTGSDSPVKNLFPPQRNAYCAATPVDDKENTIEKISLQPLSFAVGKKKAQPQGLGSNIKILVLSF